MRKEEWIQKATANIVDEMQQKAIYRQLDEKITKMMEKGSEADVLEKLGDPDKYYETHFSENSTKKINLIIGIVLTILALVILATLILSPNRAILNQTPLFSGPRGNAYFAAGVILALGILALIQSRKK